MRAVYRQRGQIADAALRPGWRRTAGLARQVRFIKKLQQWEFRNIGNNIAEVISDGIVVTEPGDALDLIANCHAGGADAVIIYEHNLAPEFFDLRTGLAGEVLQKFSTYRFRMAIVGDFGRYTSRSLADFIRESNRQGRIFFVPDREQACQLLDKSGKH